jgi:hypothetical protein
MKHVHYFSLIAEFCLGCAVFAALFESSLSIPLSILIGGSIILISLETGSRASEQEHHAKLLIMLTNAVPLVIAKKLEHQSINVSDELSRVNAEAHQIIGNGAAYVAMWAAKYAVWVGGGWALARYVV